MINITQIEFNQCKYYVPSYSNCTKVSIIKMISAGIALVQTTSSKTRESKRFSIPVEFIYNKPEDANRGRRAWENYIRKRRADKKDGKKRNH